MRLLPLLNKIKTKPEPLPETLTILLYELGDFAKCLMRSQWKADSTGYTSEMKLALGDMYAQWQVICESLGFNPDEVKELGIEHFIERMEYVKEKGE